MNFKPAREALIKKTQHKIFIASAIVTWLVGFVKLLLHPKIKFILYRNWPKCANLWNLAPCEAGNPSRKCSLEADLKQRHVAPTNHDHRWLFLFFLQKVVFWLEIKYWKKSHVLVFAFSRFGQIQFINRFNKSFLRVIWTSRHNFVKNNTIGLSFPTCVFLLK